MLRPVISFYLALYNNKPYKFFAALMEFHCNKDAMVAGKVFEVGMRTINLEEDKDAPAYVQHYLDFLISMNDDNSVFFMCLMLG